MKIRTLFLGTDWESLETLRALHLDQRFEIVGIITTPDKPVGRKQTMTPSKVKSYGIENNIPVFHTNRNQERYQDALDQFKPELVVCKAFGEIVPKFFLEYPKYKSINVHFSLLPKYRGAVPIQKAILDGEEVTGISIMLMSEGLDEGDVLKVFEEKIFPDDTNQSLRERLVMKSAEVLGNVLEQWVSGDLLPKQQDDSEATYCYQRDISKEKAKIDWENMDVEYIERMIRAFVPWPVAWTVLEKNEDLKLKDKRLKIFKAQIIEMDSSVTPGLLYSSDGRLFINTPGSSLELLEIQIEGKKQTSSKEFLHGFGGNIS